MQKNKLPRVPSRTTPGFAFSYIERALLDCLGDRQFGQSEISEVIEFFGSNPPECVFCGNPEIERWDHLVPIKKGGETLLGNMVPACRTCDDSKRDLPFDEWILSNSPSSPKTRGIIDIDERIERIKDYVQHFKYQVCPLENRLEPDEIEKLVEIRSTTQLLRQEIDGLIDNYRLRRQSTER